MNEIIDKEKGSDERIVYLSNEIIRLKNELALCKISEKSNEKSITSIPNDNPIINIKSKTTPEVMVSIITK